MWGEAMNKYIKKMLSLVLILVFVLAQMNLNINVKNVKAADNNDAAKLKILEIEPGDEYVLSKNMFSNNVDITQMPMSEFIGKIDKVNGMYDIVYVGNKTYTKYVTTYSGNKVSGKNAYAIKYSKVGTKAPKTGVDFGESNQNDPGHVEYYSENDITDKKGKELKEYIESGQLFLFDSSIFKDEELDGSKLWNNLKNYQNMPNFKAVDSNLTSSLITNYYNNSNKRPIVTIKSSPLPYTGDLKNYNPDRNMNFVFDISGDTSHTFTTKLYCDMNGDGLFKDYESYASVNKQTGGANLQLSYMVPDYFVGLMPWKLEVTDDVTNVKSYQYGYTLYKSDNVVPIRVLQIYPKGNSLDLTQDLTKVQLQQQGYYNVQITKKSCDEFNKYNDKEYQSTYNEALNDYNTALNNYNKYGRYGGSWWNPIDYLEVLNDAKANLNEVKNSMISLNGNYDMVIIGFADMYGKSSFTENATDAIIDFIKTGQSVMFTHDTLSAYLSPEKKNMYGFQFNKKLRDYLGQSRYVDENNPNETDYDGSEISHDSYPDADGIPSYGFTTDMILSHNDYNNEKPKSWGAHDYFDHKQAAKVNDGVFSEYPYVLGRNNVNPKTLNISQTHHQYFQLNLEDEDVVPWYDLSGVINTGGSAGNVNDPRNYYYTYSKGNITYSGTGHSSPRDSQDEQEMFLNTIVKAARTANHAPTVNVFNLNEGQLVSKSQNSLDFSFMAQDSDQNDEKKDALRRNIYINDKLVDENGNGISDYKTMTSGDEVKVSIPKDKLKELAGTNADVSIKIEVLDTQNAKGEKTINFKYVDEPTLSASVSGLKNGYLVGDTAETSLSINAINSTSAITDTMFLSDNNAAALQNDGLSLNCINTSNGSNADVVESSDLNLKDINFKSGNIDNPNTPKNFTLKLNSEGSYKVENLFKYNFLNLDSKVQKNYEYDYNLNVKEGDIYVKCVDSSGRVFTPSVKINITRPNSEVVSQNTDNTGQTQFLKETSGSYKVSVDNTTGYSLVGSSTQDINLSYDNPKPTVIFEFQTLTAPDIQLSPAPNTNGWNNTNVTATLVKPANFPDSLQKIQYKIDDGDWTDYIEPVVMRDDGKHEIAAKTVDKITLGESAINQKEVKIDKIKPPKPQITNKDGNISIKEANILIEFGNDGENGSGIDKREYSLDGVNWTEGASENTSIKVTNSCTVYAREEDKAGNYSDTAELEVNIINITNNDIELEGLTFNTIPEGGSVDFIVKVKIGTDEKGEPIYSSKDDNVKVVVKSDDGNIIKVANNSKDISDSDQSKSDVIAGADVLTAFGIDGAGGKNTNITVTLEKDDSISITKNIKVIKKESGLLY